MVTRFLAKLLRVLLTGTAFLLFWTGGAILSWIVVPLISFRYRHDPQLRGRRCREVICSAFRLHARYARVCRLVEFDPRTIEAQLPKAPFVLVANHPTLLDVVLLLASSPSICCVAKGVLFRGPLVGRLLKASNHLDAGDGSPFSAGRVVETAIERLKGGDSVLVFPEGTRSPKEGLGAFKPGAFVMAVRAKVPVVLVRITCIPRGLMKGMPWYTVPDGTMNFTMTVLPEFDVSRFGGDARALAAEARTVFERSLAQDPADAGLPPGAVPADRLRPMGRVVDGRVGT